MVLEQVKKLVLELMEFENSGHGNDHILRVYNLAMKFTDTEGGNKDIIGMAALLHDVDDYKLVGVENSKNLTNAKQIMNTANVPSDIQEKVLEILDSMGYKKLLSGIRPKSLEGKIVSDADMCDALGANGILRIAIYTNKHNRPFFNKDVWPIENMDSSKYTRLCADSAVCHFFEKVLKLRRLMLTNAGKEEAIVREKITIDFLRNVFSEQNANEWNDYLDNYLANLDLEERNNNEKIIKN